jgi:hypothetical protein
VAAASPRRRITVIKKRTVFVLGAGAHVPYRFSTGEGLLMKARDLSIDQMMKLTDGQLRPSELKPIKDALTDNFLPSIDALLERRTDLRRAGKKLMMSLLLGEEAAYSSQKWLPDEDWMSLVFKEMADSAETVEQFGENPVSFITFNYDRLLEYRLIRGLAVRYNVPTSQVWSAIKGFRFIHVYGSLGCLPEQAATSSNGSPIPFGAPESSDVSFKGLALGRAESLLSIVHDVQGDQQFADAHQLLHTSQTQQICFFGFAFGKENVDRLRTRQIPTTTSICCTTYKMTSAEVVDSVYPSLPNHPPQGLNLIHEDATIREFLRKRIWVFR